MERKIRKVDNNVYLPILKELVEEGKSVSLLISGSSMSPFLIHGRDTIIISKPHDSFKRGDLVFYNRDSGQFVMHRIHHIDKNGDLYIIGDAQEEIEGPIHSNQVFGIIKKVIRKGKTLEEGNFWWWFFQHIWIHLVFFRKYIVKVYNLFFQYLKNNENEL